MIQQVNLYVLELRPSQERLQARGALAVLALGVVLVALLAGIVGYQNAGMAKQTAALEQQNRRLEQVVAELSETVRSRQPDAEVEAALARVTGTLARRQRLLERVESLVVSGGGRFSPQMAALARQIPENVWLTGVALQSEPSRVTIEGRSLSGALVPLYLENLGEEAAFTGRTFGAFRLSRPDEGRWIDFRVSTGRTGEDS
ncbi:PilN domain-containing protein [uncultured Marinobacter sp.]|uniref:PilN domain-containing protein n=1 Tax=uncultured Marinobacter sp. TaxID=187379 RepID=UPI0030D7BB3C|tara:strand:- start:82929 stop:83534 length:606 start_codon:yes stop_codon:yes gene_type:complete